MEKREFVRMTSEAKKVDDSNQIRPADIGSTGLATHKEQGKDVKETKAERPWGRGV